MPKIMSLQHYNNNIVLWHLPEDMFGQKSSSSRSHCWSCPGMVVPTMSCKRGYRIMMYRYIIVINNTRPYRYLHYVVGTRRRVSPRSSAVHDKPTRKQPLRFPFIIIILYLRITRTMTNFVITMQHYDTLLLSRVRFNAKIGGGDSKFITLL